MGLTAQLVEKYIQEKAIRGAVLYFGTPSETLFAEAFGVADHRSGRAMTLDSVFDMASVTKALDEIPGQVWAAAQRTPTASQERESLYV